MASTAVQTARAVRRFQREEGLAATGRVDRATRAALFGGTSTGGTSAGQAPPDGIVAAARRALGRPYETGADGPDAFDCSGLVVWAARAVGTRACRARATRSSAKACRSGATRSTPATSSSSTPTGPGASDVGIAVSCDRSHLGDDPRRARAHDLRPLLGRALRRCAAHNRRRRRLTHAHDDAGRARRQLERQEIPQPSGRGRSTGTPRAAVNGARPPGGTTGRSQAGQASVPSASRAGTPLRPDLLQFHPLTAG